VEAHQYERGWHEEEPPRGLDVADLHGFRHEHDGEGGPDCDHRQGKDGVEVLKDVAEDPATDALAELDFHALRWTLLLASLLAFWLLLALLLLFSA
jgi:hypothetical protein